MIPRLDEYEIWHDRYDGKMEEVAQKLEIAFLNVKEQYPHTDRQIWFSRDGIHIRENKGLLFDDPYCLASAISARSKQ